jgi:hypothetical protein
VAASALAPNAGAHSGRHKTRNCDIRYTAIGAFGIPVR